MDRVDEEDKEDGDLILKLFVFNNKSFESELAFVVFRRRFLFRPIDVDIRLAVFELFV